MLLFKKYPTKSPAEILVENGVDDRIEGRVHVAKPESDGKSGRWDGAHLAHRREDVHEEKRKPARDERAHN